MNENSCRLGGNYAYVDLDEIIGKLSVHDQKVFDIIVSGGISQESIAIKRIQEEMIPFEVRYVSNATAWRDIKYLVDLNLFAVTKISTGVRNISILSLTNVGMMVYMMIFKRNAGKFEHQLLAEDHDNAVHAYMILDTKSIMEEKGIYYGVSMDRSRNTIQLHDGRECIPDVVGLRKGEMDLYEVECGNHHQADFDNKLNKLTRVTKCINIVGPNRNVVTKKLKKQVENWIVYNGRIDLLRRGIIVRLTTITDLKNDKWTYIYDMTMDEPICCFGKKKGGES